jgi:SAM-dependent methyltransferase
MRRFKTQVQQAINASFQGWDFSYIAQYGGDAEEPHPWSYVRTVRQYLEGKAVFLDMGTGGGEFLASLKPLPAQTYATEAYAPNVPVARSKLEPLGVTVVEVEEGVQENFSLPFENAFFELIINRHESYESSEVYRTLQPGGVFITQQVGERNNENLRMTFGSIDDDFTWNDDTGQSFLKDAGFNIIDAKEHIGYSRMYDIRTLVYLMKVLPWEFPNFDPVRYETQLRNIYIKILEDGYFDTTCHRFFIIAEKN